MSQRFQLSTGLVGRLSGSWPLEAFDLRTSSPIDFETEIELVRATGSQALDIPIGDGSAGTLGIDIDNGRVCVSSPHITRLVIRSALIACCAVGAWQRGGVLFHGAGISQAGSAVVALAPSGGGKSTLTNLAPVNSASLSDEAVIILPRGPRLFVESTGIRSASTVVPTFKCVALSALLLLEKSSSPLFSFVKESDSYRALLKQGFSFPAKCGLYREYTSRVANIAREIPGFRFFFPATSAATSLLEQFFKDEPWTQAS